MTILVECINTREEYPDQLHINEKYKLDTDSIYGDDEGTWYGIIYNMYGVRIGRLSLNHFKSIM